MIIRARLSRMLGWQLMGAINVLRDGFDHDGEPLNCCPVCCNPCRELLRVLESPDELVELNALLAEEVGILGAGWDYWSDSKQGLKVNKILKLWFRKDRSLKAVCVSVDGVDQSEMWHEEMRSEGWWQE